ncbi:UNC-like C-terminal-domain-containing protein [Irpex rosettiformis]|uniref:UNC-like C-terminal-domain-containing protein n=1 Tax=Irpex rosettiformis TaxID=378272 RepID=A0ACB8U320_9APHY|nr:UNC-like C-terminal-domain-containing protein [Irpex rosettiformis]
MWLKSFLPVAFVLPAFSAPPTPNDPFHNLALQAPKHDDGPVCCLRPLSPPESPEEDVLLSFEEWKERQMASILKEQLISPTPPSPSSQTQASVPASNASSNPVVFSSSLEGNQGTQPAETVEAPVPDAPYFSIPITDRFNYASMDCSARVHTAHKSAKSPASILSSKKDRYMLSPCNEKKQFVVVELCDDIRIDTVQLANYEFFSGVFKDFTVSVAKTYNGEWVTAGTYQAKNTRNVQSFHPPTTLSDFYRFVRIDFHSHYGNEYYCPLSLFRVYGLTHLEHWKWDLWESESKAKRALEESASSAESAPEPPRPLEGTGPSPQELLAEDATTSCTTCGSPPIGHAPPTVVSPAKAESNENTRTSSPSSPSHIMDTQAMDVHLTSAEPSGTQFSIPSASQTITHSSAASNPADGPADSHPLPPSQQSLKLDTSNDSERQHITDALYNTQALSSSMGYASHSVSLSLSSPASAQGSPSSSATYSSPVGPSVSVNHSAHSNRSSSATASATFSQSLVVVTPTVPSSNGESIYRTIMNRLTALETNTSLYARFVEDHTANVREMLRKLSEEVGRLEGLGNAQAQTYQRTVLQFERQQRRIELEHSELLQRVSRLTDEVVLEKRLGIAQLCLSLAVLVVMALTRGSRTEPVRTGGSEGESVRSRTSSLRGWGRRTLSISGDWMNRFTSRSASPPPSRHVEAKTLEHKKPLNLTIHTGSSQGIQAEEVFPRYKRVHPSPGGRRLGLIVRPRTPTTGTTQSYSARYNSPLHFPTTPTRIAQMTAPLHRTGPRERPPILRSHSSTIGQSFSTGMIPPGPKSAKHWARTAHLHEVKNVGTRTTRNVAKIEPMESSDVFSSGTVAVGMPSSREKRARGVDGELDVSGMENRTNGHLGCVDLEEGVLQQGENMSEVEVDGGEGDVWVDTDADDSGVESLHDSAEDIGSCDL